MDDIDSLILIGVLIALTAFFVASEFAIVRVRRSRIDQLITEGNKRAILQGVSLQIWMNIYPHPS